MDVLESGGAERRRGKLKSIESASPLFMLEVVPPAAASQLLITFVNKPSGEENLFLNHIIDGRGWWGKFTTDIMFIMVAPGWVIQHMSPYYIS